MDNILIHIGLYKTGTTWLQKYLFTLESNYFFPLSDYSTGPSSLALKFVYDENRYLLNSFSDNKKIIQEGLRQILKSESYKPDKIPVISHERLSGSPHSSGFDAAIIARRIQAKFPEAKILICIREQSSWLLSNYFQYLKGGGNLSITKYLYTKYDGKRPAFSPGYLEYHYLIQDYQKRFSKENVLVIPYELFSTDHTKFLKSLGDFVQTDLSQLQLDFETKVNSSEDHYLNYKLRFLNQFRASNSLNNYSPYSSAFNSKIIYKSKKVLRTIVSKQKNENIKEQLRRQIHEWAKERFISSNEITAEITGLDLEMFGYQMPKKS